MKKSRGTILIDLVMYGILMIQMLYAFIGNTVHEILGILLFLCVITHIILKRKRFKAIFRKGAHKNPAVRLSEIVTMLLFLCLIIMLISSMGVSRLLFPWFRMMSSPWFHRLFASVILMLSVIHGGMHVYLRTKRKKLTIAVIVLFSILSLVLGLWAVPYMNRHFRRVELDYEETVRGGKVEWPGEKPLVVYFTRVGNTDFKTDVDVVSGASLAMASGELMGNTQILADMICDAVGCEDQAITLTAEKYPSSYNDTVSVAREELANKELPEILPIDVTDYETIILVYPIWWGTVPRPVASFLLQNDFAGKRIILMATQGSSGFANSTADVKDMVPEAEVMESLSIYCDDIPKVREDISEWLRTCPK